MPLRPIRLTREQAAHREQENRNRDCHLYHDASFLPFKKAERRAFPLHNSPVLSWAISCWFIAGKHFSLTANSKTQTVSQQFWCANLACNSSGYALGWHELANERD